MLTNGSLRLFPSPDTSIPRFQKVDNGRAPIDDFRGLALQVTSTPPDRSNFRSATDLIDHGLFCDEALGQAARSRFSASTAQSKAKRRPFPETTTASTSSYGSLMDERKPLALSALFPDAPHSTTTRRLVRSNIPVGISAVKSPPEPSDEDQLSPLPEKTCFTVCQTKNHENPSSLQAIRSVTPSPPPRSMFPQYDHSKPLHAQDYSPTVGDLAVSSERVGRTGNSISRPAIRHFDSAAGLIESYEGIAVANSSDLGHIRDACNNRSQISCRKVQLGLYQQPQQTSSIALGVSANDLVFSISKDETLTHGRQASGLSVHRLCPKSVPTPVARVPLPDDPEKGSILLFPEAQTMHGCKLVRTVRKREGLGTVTARYNLQHPQQGIFPVTVTKSTSKGSPGNRARIALHHCDATPAAIGSETLILASIDFARNACVLDIPGLLALDCPFIIDIAASALLTVAVIENETLQKEAITFAAPPKAPFKPSVTKRSSLHNNEHVKENKALLRLKSLRRTKQQQVEQEQQSYIWGEQVEIPSTFAMIRKSLKARIAATRHVIAGVGSRSHGRGAPRPKI